MVKLCGISAVNRVTIQRGAGARQGLPRLKVSPRRGIHQQREKPESHPGNVNKLN